jgi:hypothetical protein
MREKQPGEQAKAPQRQNSAMSKLKKTRRAQKALRPQLPAFAKYQDNHK